MKKSQIHRYLYSLSYLLSIAIELFNVFPMKINENPMNIPWKSHENPMKIPWFSPRRPPAPFAAWTWRSSRSWWRWRRRPRPRPCTATRGRRRRRRCSPRRVGVGTRVGRFWEDFGGNLEETWRKLGGWTWGKMGVLSFNISSCFKNILSGDGRDDHVRLWS